MAAHSYPGGNLPLEEYNERTPPGWQPGLPNYPWKRYFERLQLWNRMTTAEIGKRGILVHSRLKGDAHDLGLKTSSRNALR